MARMHRGDSLLRIGMLAAFLAAVLTAVPCVPSTAIAAPTPHLLDLQGRAADADGLPLVAGDLAVRIYIEASGGAPIFDSGGEFSGAVLDGLFDVLLGSATSLALDNTLLYHLEIDVDGTEVVGDAAGGRIAFYPGGGSHARSDLEARLVALEGELGVKNLWDRPAGPILATAGNKFGGSGGGRVLACALLGSGVASGVSAGGERRLSGHLLWHPVGEHAAGDRRVYLGPYYSVTSYGTLVLDPGPDQLAAPWLLSGPDKDESGSGDATLRGRTAGSYTVTWGPVAGWAPLPATETRLLAPLGTATLAATFTSQPAHIDSIVDVPDDQGGWVRLHFTRCGLDISVGDWPDTPVSAYNVHRRVDDVALAQAVLAQADSPEELAAAATPPAGDSRLVAHADRWFLIAGAATGADRDLAAKEAPPGVWEVVQTVLARQQTSYLALVPTLADSLAAEPIVWTRCFVSAHTTIPSIFFDSAPDSGYSTDDIAPGVPTGLCVSYGAAGNDLQWNPAPEADFQYHRVYRGEAADFEPSPSLLVHATGGTGWTDPDGRWSDHYKVSTVDHAGNEGPAAAPDEVSAVQGQVPEVFALRQNRPNPFNPATTIVFDLPRSCRVDLRVYDVSGRLIRTLLADEPLAEGRWSAVWRGRDDADRGVAAGVYYCRLRAGSFQRIRSMVLVK